MTRSRSIKFLHRVGEQQEEQVALRMAPARLPELVADRHQQVDDPLVVALSVGNHGLGSGDRGGQVVRPWNRTERIGGQISARFER